jgi:hypothetical protein
LVLLLWVFDFTGATRATFLSYVSSYIRAVEMDHYPVGGCSNTQVFSQ